MGVILYKPNKARFKLAPFDNDIRTVTPRSINTQSRYDAGFVSPSDNGDRCVVGMCTSTRPPNTVGPYSPGVAYVYARSGDIWTREATLAGPAGNSAFGRETCMSGNGLYCAVSDYYLNNVRIYKRTGSTWSQTALITTVTGSPYHFGRSLSMDYAGTTLVSVLDEVSTNYGSRVFIDYLTDGVRTGGLNFYVEGLPTNSVVVSICGDATRLIVGNCTRKFSDHDGLTDAQGAIRCGRVYIYKKSSGYWSLEKYFEPPNVCQSGAFGASVSMSFNGKKCVAAYPGSYLPGGARTATNYSGAIYIMNFGTSWTISSEITEPLGRVANNYFGEQVIMSSNGEKIFTRSVSKAYVLTNTSGSNATTNKTFAWSSILSNRLLSGRIGMSRDGRTVFRPPAVENWTGTSGVAPFYSNN